jgi:hypothetical protein
MIYRSIFSALAASTCIVALATPAAAQTRSYDIPASDLPAALDQFAQQSGAQIVYKVDEVRGKRSKSVKGSYDTGEALRRLLSGSGFEARRDDSGAFAVVRVGNGQDGADIASSSGGDEVAENQQGVSEILVVGSRSQNVDIRRTQDDPQPYIIFNKADIQHSGATNLTDYFRTRLTTSPLVADPLQAATTDGGASRIDVRGLGTDETLILINGRRAPAFSRIGSAAQPDINAIPLSAIERIEVLPTTASGIYGGSATGGVINIILKSNFDGVSASAGYGDSIHAGGDNKRFDILAGLNLEGGKTNVTFTGSYSKTASLLVGDRDFVDTGRWSALEKLVQF